jgi:hypothetical protein
MKQKQVQLSILFSAAGIAAVAGITVLLSFFKMLTGFFSQFSQELLSCFKHI